MAERPVAEAPPVEFDLPVHGGFAPDRYRRDVPGRRARTPRSSRSPGSRDRIRPPRSVARWGCSRPASRSSRRRGRPGARHDRQRLHVRVAAAPARRDLGGPAGEDARPAPRGAPLRDQRARRRAARRCPIASPVARARASEEVEFDVVHETPLVRRCARAPGRAGGAFVLGRGPLAVRGPGGVRPVRGRAAAAVPRRPVRAPRSSAPPCSPSLPPEILAAITAARGRADLRAGGVRRSRGRPGRRALRDPRGGGSRGAEGEPARDVRAGGVLRRGRGDRRPAAERRRRRRRRRCESSRSRASSCERRSSASPGPRGRCWRCSPAVSATTEPSCRSRAARRARACGSRSRPT